MTHDVFASFGYGFGDMDALIRVNFYWLTIPIMGAVGAQSICYLSSATYKISRVQFLVLGRSSMHTGSS